MNKVDLQFLRSGMTSYSNATYSQPVTALAKFTYFRTFTPNAVKVSNWERTGLRPELNNHLTREDNCGPLLAWMLYYRSRPWVGPVCFDDNGARLRAMGYVMWNAVKAEATVSTSPDGEKLLRAMSEQARKAQLEMQKSFGERTWYYRHGGRGWWSFKDKSQIQFPQANESKKRKR